MMFGVKLSTFKGKVYLRFLEPFDCFNPIYSYNYVDGHIFEIWSKIQSELLKFKYQEINHKGTNCSTQNYYEIYVVK